MKHQAFVAKPRCVKCGGRDIYRTYHKKDFYGSADCVLGSGNHNEHHDMYCRTCGYEWPQKVREAR